jgi:hypothetical protein
MDLTVSLITVYGGQEVAEQTVSVTAFILESILTLEDFVAVNLQLFSP